MSKKRNREIIIGTAIGLGLVGGGIGIYYAVKKRDTGLEEPKHNYEVVQKADSIYDNVEVFPKLNVANFYQYIQMLNGKPIFTDDFIAAVMNKVFEQMKITDGNIEVAHQISENGQEASVSFRWLNKTHGEKGKTYKFSLSV